MLNRLELNLVGPAPHLGPLDFGRRLNLLTGDNGAGKSFILDIAWWALTGAWPGHPAWPRMEASRQNPPSILSQISGARGVTDLRSSFDFKSQSWNRPTDLAADLVAYFRVDGEISLWDPAQTYSRRSRSFTAEDELPEALHFSSKEIWDGVKTEDGRTLCRGLIEDWVSWQQTGSDEFRHLELALTSLSPSPSEPLKIGEPADVWLEDRRKQPVLDLPYGPTPVTLTSAGIQQILKASYLLTWAWHSHRRALGLKREEPTRRFVILFDEPETHLHPQWQRRILPALLANLAGPAESANVQLIVSTHSPLVLASLETRFDSETDRIFHFAFDEDDGAVKVETPPFVSRGDVVGWLISDIFGMRQARSVEAEVAIESAERLMRGESSRNPPHLRSIDELHRELLRTLGDSDPFWPRWLVRTKQV